MNGKKCLGWSSLFPCFVGFGLWELGGEEEGEEMGAVFTSYIKKHNSVVS